MSLMPGFEQVPPDVWDAIAQRLGGAPGPPEPPAYAPPDLIAPTASTFRTRLADALAGVDNYAGPRPMEGGASAAVRGLLSGASQGFSNRVRTEGGRAEKEREAVNATRKAESDRNYANAQDTWRAKLTAFYRTQADERGKVRVTKRMAEDMGVPEAAGTLADPLEVSGKITARLGALKPSGQGQAGVVGFDPDAVADGMAAGTLPMDPAGYSRGQWGVIAGKLAKRGVDVTKLTLNYRAIRQQVATMNQGQSLQYRAAISKAAPTLDYTEQLVDQLQALVPSGRVREFNAMQLAAVTRGALGPQAASVATQLVGQINGPLNGEMATVYSRGGVPTDEARRGVQRQINENMGTGNLRAAIAAMRRDLNFAQTAMDEVGAWSPWNPSPGGTMRPFDLGPRSIPGPTPADVDEFAKYRR